MSGISPQEAQARLELMELDRRTELLEKARRRSGTLRHRLQHVTYALVLLALAAISSWMGSVNYEAFTVMLIVAVSVGTFAKMGISTLHRRVDAMLELLAPEAPLDGPAADPSDAGF